MNTIQKKSKKQKRLRRVLKGTVISPGITSGIAFPYTDILFRNHDLYSIKYVEIADEYMRIELAINEVILDLATSAERVEKELNAKIAGIFLSQIEILKDTELLKEIRSELEATLVNAEQVILRVFRKWELRFRQVQDEIIRSRAEDIVDLSRRLLRALVGLHVHTLENLPQDCIIVARHLLPSDTVYLSRNDVKGIITEIGGTASHTALLTREIGIPSIGNVKGAVEQIRNNDFLLLDCINEEIVINPDNGYVKDFEKRIIQHKKDKSEFKIRSRAPAISTSGTFVEVLANVSCRDDVIKAVNNGADGIGLFRIENIYLSKKMPLSSNELMDQIIECIDTVKEKIVTIRLLDIGGDKQLPYLNSKHDDDSFLGRRGIRFLLEYPELLYTQFNALVKVANDFNIRILVPMITFSHEMKIVREIFNEISEINGLRNKIPLGAMIETPAAALCIEDIVPLVDFVSIGTNDLTQYVMAAGRENQSVINYFRDDHKAILKLIDIIINGAGDMPLSLCGELASNCNVVHEIVRKGIKSLSVAPIFIPEIKECIRKI